MFKDASTSLVTNFWVQTQSQLREWWRLIGQVPPFVKWLLIADLLGMMLSATGMYYLIATTTKYYFVVNAQTAANHVTNSASHSTSSSPNSTVLPPDQVDEWETSQFLASNPVSSQELAAQDQFVTVEVAGAVNQPGVYQLSQQDRVATALEAAGGLSSSADSGWVATQLHLASKLVDEQKIYVPFQVEPAAVSDEGVKQLGGASASPIPAQSLQESGSNLVSINTATQSELDALPGIGEKRAQDIINNRPYTAIKDLIAREVVSQAVFNDLQTAITL